ncbi:MAG: hypothetical protein ABJA67_03365 [Chthonomonadales bacterium]
MMTPELLFGAFLFAFIFWMCLTLGFTGMLLLHHTLRAEWGLPLLRIFEAGSKCLLPMGAIFFVAWFAGMNKLYPWMNSATVAADPVLRLKSLYLNQPGFLIRAVVVFAIWIGWSMILNKSTKTQETTGDNSHGQLRSNVAAPGIVFFILSVTVAVTDWVMSLDAHWYSTMYGFWFVIGQALAAMSFSVFYTISRANTEPYKQVVTPKMTKDWGNMMLMMSMVWAYFTFSQFLIMWSGNIPVEVGYFYHRMQGPWDILGTIVVIAQFFIPFLLLLSGRTKRTPMYLKTVAGWIFVARILDLYWNIGPYFVKNTETQGPITMSAPFALMFLGVGAVWFAFFTFFKKQNTTFPTYDSRLIIQEVAPNA